MGDEEPARFEGRNLGRAWFSDVNLAGARIRESNLTGSRMTGVLLIDADIDGVIDGLMVNGVHIGPLVQAELDRRHPERRELRPNDVASARRALAVVEQLWEPTMARAAALTDDARHRSVDGEWSFMQTMRHLLFVTDAWFRHAVLDLAEPFSPNGLPPSFIHDGAGYGIDHSADPSYDTVQRERAERFVQLGRYLDSVDDATLTTAGPPASGPGYPGAAARAPVDCLKVIFSEEWEHHRFANRDLDAG